MKHIYFLFTLIFFQSSVMSQPHLHESPVLVNKKDIMKLSSILHLPERILLSQEVNDGNLYLWISDVDLQKINADGIGYTLLKRFNQKGYHLGTDNNSAPSGVTPELDDPTYTGDPYVGSTITIYLTGRNASYISWSNDPGYITMTLPDFCNVTDFGGDSNWDEITKAICGNSIWTCYNTQISAVDVLIDGYEDGWDIRETKTIWAKVVPTQPGNLYVYSKMSIGALRDPSGSCQGPDQQAWPVYQRYLTVTNKPNLKPVTPSGWSYPIVPASITGTNTVNTLYGIVNTYIDWAIKNYDANITSSFKNALYIDNVFINDWTTSSLSAGSTITVTDYIRTLTTGTHTLKIVADYLNAVVESNETDNTYYHDFIWTNPSPNAPAFYSSGSLSLYPTKSYSIQVDYTDNNGAGDLQNVYLRLAQNDNETTNRITMMWGLSGSVSQWADETQAVTEMSATKTSITNGYRVTWNFKLKWNWVENTNIDYWAFATDDANAESTHTKQNQNAFYENDIRILASSESGDPITAGDEYTVTGSVCFEGTNTTPDDWSGISVEMRKTTVSGTLLDTDNSISGGYSVTWDTQTGDVGPHDVYILPMNTNHPPPNNSETYWDLETVTINPDLITTRIKDNDIFIDKTAKYGIPILLEAKLQYYQTLIWWDLSGQTVNFEIYYDGSWHTIPDDGISSTSFITNSGGIASVYYTAPTNLSEGNYEIRARYSENITYAGCELQKVLNIHKPQWLFLIYMCGDNNLEEAFCESFYSDIRPSGNNDEVSVVVLFDRAEDVAGESGYTNGYGNWEVTRYCKILKNDYDIYEDWGECNFGLSATLTYFITEATNSCLANNICLITTVRLLLKQNQLVRKFMS